MYLLLPSLTMLRAVLFAIVAKGMGPFFSRPFIPPLAVAPGTLHVCAHLFCFQVLRTFADK